MAIKAGNPKSAGVELMRIRDWLLWLISADKPVRLGIPSYTKDRDQYGQGAGRQNEFRIVKKKTARLTPKAHLEIFPRLKLSFHLFTALTLLACEYLLSGSAFKSSYGRRKKQGQATQFPNPINDWNCPLWSGN
jgi:hypothetical protein